MLPAMSLPRTTARFATALLAAMLLAACGRDRETDAATLAPEDDRAVADLAEDFDGAWQGVLPCVDCVGIEVELTLRRAPGESARFRLVERYLGGATEGEFVSTGEWQEDTCALAGETGSCIVLVDAAQRWFRHEDGSLQAIDAEGLPLDRDGALLKRR